MTPAHPCYGRHDHDDRWCERCSAAWDGTEWAEEQAAKEGRGGGRASDEEAEEFHRLRGEIGVVLSENGCDCKCGCDTDGHILEECDPCLACRIGATLHPRAGVERRETRAEVEVNRLREWLEWIQSQCKHLHFRDDTANDFMAGIELDATNALRGETWEP